MEIKTMKKAKKQVESEIRAIINMFENQTELVVERVNLSRAHNFGEPSYITSVEMDVAVE